MRRFWPLGMAAILGAALGSGSMAFYLYSFQLRSQSNTARIEKLEKRPRPTCRPCPATTREHPTAVRREPWWKRVWR